MGIYNLISFLGIFALMLVTWAFSTNRRNINWRVVFRGVVLQLLFALFVLLDSNRRGNYGKGD